MQAFDELRPLDTVSLLREIALCLTPYSIGRDNHYRAIVEIAIKRPGSILLSTTNYDLLIEQAITEANHFIAFHTGRLKPRNVRLLKIHGSVHFLLDTFGATFTNVRADVSKARPDAAAFGGRIRVVESGDEVIRYLHANNTLSPSIAVYAPRKRVLVEPSFVDQQLRQWQAAIKAADRIFVIGLGVNEQDEHVWGPLRKSRGWLYYVSPQSTPFENWVAKTGRKKASTLAETFADSVPLIKRVMRA